MIMIMFLHYDSVNIYIAVREGGRLQTLYPSYIQELSLRWQVWSSKGKYITLTGHVDLNLVGGAQNTLPLDSTIARLRNNPLE